MNADHLIDHALGRLEVPDCEHLEHHLRNDPAAAARADQLARAIQLLLDDGESYDPPPGLSQRTLSLVAQSRSRSPSILEYAPVRVPFRWADFAVAASIFIAGLLTLMPAIQRSRERMSQAGCVFNLQQLGSSLAQYATMNPVYPYPPGSKPETHAGMFAAVLHDAGVLNDLTILDCPNNRKGTVRANDLPSFDQLERLRVTDPEHYRRMVSSDYAYNVGYRHDSGQPGPVEARLPMAVPVVADQPPHVNYETILSGNSPNHASRGQNVLYNDGSVKWHRSRFVSSHDPDLYLNNGGEQKPGIDKGDSALFPSFSPFKGLHHSH